MAWYWGRPDVVRIAVSAVGADGEERRWFEDVGPGPDNAWTIPMPEGARIRAITVVRPVRVRVDLGRHR